MLLLIENLNTDFRSFGIAENNGLSVRDVELRPGVNEIESKDWEQGKKHPVIKHLIKRGRLKVRPYAGDFERVKASEAEDIVLNTFDMELLRKWAGLKLAPGVLDIVKAQIAEMTLPPPDAKE